MPKKSEKRKLSTSHASPTFVGDKVRLVKTVDGKDCNPAVIPPCFSDPDLTSGQCNPNVPLKDGEQHLCSLHKSCLVAKMLSCRIPISPRDLVGKSYDSILLTADDLFDNSTEGRTAPVDREQLRGFLFSLDFKNPKNPFRLHSTRWHILEALSKGWTNVETIIAQLRLMKVSERRIESSLLYVTAITTQECYQYRILEQHGQYRAFAR